MVEIFSFILQVEYDLSQWLLSDFGLIPQSIFLDLVLASGSSSSINTHSSDNSFTHSPLVTSIIGLSFIYTFLCILIDSPWHLYWLIHLFTYSHFSFHSHTSLPHSLYSSITPPFLPSFIPLPLLPYLPPLSLPIHPFTHSPTAFTNYLINPITQLHPCAHLPN